jgi:hypothetical protein
MLMQDKYIQNIHYKACFIAHFVVQFGGHIEE